MPKMNCSLGSCKKIPCDVNKVDNSEYRILQTRLVMLITSSFIRVQEERQLCNARVPRVSDSVH